MYYKYNEGQTTPVFFNETNKQIGLSEITVSLVDGVFNCTFNRVKELNIDRYSNLNETFYLLIANGLINEKSLHFNFFCKFFTSN